jgi:hypothetical protein
MPRLIGKKPNYTLIVLPIVAIVALGAVAAKMEYMGSIDVVPEFGPDRVRN